MTYKMTLRRKLAIASWSSPREGNIYGKLCLDMGNALDYIEYLRKTTGEKITITHIIGKAASLALAEAPDLNGRIFLGKYYPHKTVDIAFLVTFEGGSDLAKFKICNVDKKSLVEIAKELKAGAEILRAGKDEEFEKPKAMIKVMPTFMVKFFIWLMGYIAGAAGLSVKFLNIEKFPFGSAIVTSLGMFGIDEGYAPPTPFARVPLYLTIPAIKNRPVVIDDKIVIRPMLDLTATIDHRFLDGHRGAILAKKVREVIENPWLMDGLSTAPEQCLQAHIDHKSAICDKAQENGLKS